MATKSAAQQLTLNPSLFDATGRAPAKVVTAPPIWDPFSGAAPMSDADHDRWLDRQAEEREWALDARG